MFRSLLIANRGEIAVRIIRTCRLLGIHTVAVYSDADSRALHVQEADSAVHIGASPPADSYLNIERIIRAARETGAEALHPGYGLLSENPLLADACREAGIAFVGPPAEAIRLMGDKAAARKLASARGVPTIPGYNGEEQDPERLLAAAEAIGFPVMIKAAAGGGGRGMRLVEDRKRFPDAADSARREAERAFGDGRLVLEKAIVGGRHIELQVLADAHGNVVHLGERDCSVQRRHQKVIEETPSPVVYAELRQRMGVAAVEIARAVGYVNAGTVEFMLDAEGNFYFLEMNTRLQVEHGVTELVTGLDLVALQIAVAAGEPLPFRQEQVASRGHAIECRIYAEDPLNRYLPSPGRITVFRLPEGEGVRNDVGTYEGDEVTTYYDPMLAKVLTWGRDRPEALHHMERALTEYRIEGVRTNLNLLAAVVRHPAFVHRGVTTDFLETQFNPEALVPLAAEEPLIAAFGALLLGVGADADPWRAPGPWRSGGLARLDLERDGAVYVMEGRRVPKAADQWLITLLGRERKVRFALARPDTVLLEWDGLTRSSRVYRAAGGLEVEMEGQRHFFQWSFGEHHQATAEHHRLRGLTAPMPGLVLKVLVRPGQRVRQHQLLVVLEAMKMEHMIEAPYDGVVRAVHCAQGGRVGEGDILVEVEQEIL